MKRLCNQSCPAGLTHRRMVSISSAASLSEPRRHRLGSNSLCRTVVISAFVAFHSDLMPRTVSHFSWHCSWFYTWSTFVLRSFALCKDWLRSELWRKRSRLQGVYCFLMQHPFGAASNASVKLCTCSCDLKGRHFFPESSCGGVPTQESSLSCYCSRVFSGKTPLCKRVLV